MSTPNPPVYAPGGGYGRPLPFTDLTGPRVLQYLLDSLISLGISLVGLVGFLPALLTGDGGWLVVGLLVFMVASYAASFWVEVGHPARADGQTYGMAALELRVVDEATLGPPTTRQLTLRWLMLLLVDGGFIALILIVVTDKHQRVGDMLAKTLVVRADDPLVAQVRAAAGAPPARGDGPPPGATDPAAGWG